MKLKILLLTIMFPMVSALSQTNFEPGYIIRTNGTKVDCLIKNEDWKGSPSSFIYKLNENDEVKSGTVSNISEFGSDNNFKYIVATISMEQASDKVNNLGRDRNPDFKDETLFLKVLVEGDASLYYTLKNGDIRFFYKMDDKIEPLIYKRFLMGNNQIGENNRFKQQLATEFKCATSKNSDFEKLEYKKSSLIKRFINYNNCSNGTSIVYHRKDFQYGFNFSLRPGIVFGTSSIKQSGEPQMDLESKMGFRVGLEAEYILPFNNGKWSFFVEPTYRYYQGEKEIAINKSFPTFPQTTAITVVYNSVELPIGGRYYMFLNSDSAIFINGAAIIDLSLLDTNITSTESDYNLDFKSETGFAFGAGFRFKNKYSIEARYLLPKNIIDYVNVSAKYQSFSLIAGYNFL